MCDASKDMKDVVVELIKELRAESAGHNSRTHRMFSVRELTVPLLYVVPLMVSIFVGSLTVNSYINNMQATFDKQFAELQSNLKDVARELIEVKTDAVTRTYDRVTRTDLVQICYNWQVRNKNIDLQCNNIYNIQHLNSITGPKK